MIRRIAFLALSTATRTDKRVSFECSVVYTKHVVREFDLDESSRVSQVPTAVTEIAQTQDSDGDDQLQPPQQLSQNAPAGQFSAHLPPHLGACN